MQDNGYHRPTRRLGVCPALDPMPPVRGVPGTTILEADPVETFIAISSSCAFFALLYKT